MSDPTRCCRCCCSTIFSAGLTALIFWLCLQNTNPHSSIEYFYLPALNNSNDPTKPNTTIYFHLKLENPNVDKGIYYDALNLTFRYQPPLNDSSPIIGTLNNNTFEVIGNKTIHGFYQGHKKKATRKDSVDPRGVDWNAVYREVLNEKKVVFRVDLETAVRVKYIFWIRKRQKIKVGANVEVNDKGVKNKKKGIDLKSGAGQQLFCYPAPLVGVGVLGFLLLVL